MIHEDGIEVYLKPVGPASENFRFAEFPLEDVQINGQPDNDRNRRCVVLAQDEPFRVVVRIKESFKMYSANSLSIGTYCRLEPPTSPSGTTPFYPLPRKIIQMSKVYEQYVRSKLGWERGIGIDKTTTSLEMRHSAEALAGEFDEVQPASINVSPPQEGTILVALHRCNNQWIDETGTGENVSKSSYGPGDPTTIRKSVRNSSKALASVNGKRYFFEFRYRSQKVISALRQPNLEHPSGLSQAARLAFLVEDNEFVVKRKEDRTRRRELRAEYQKQQQPAAEIDEAERPESRARTPYRTSGNAEKAPPKFCDCPNPAHKRPRQKIPSTSRSKSSKAAGPTGFSSTPRTESPDGHVADEELEDGSDSVELAVVTTCVSCKNLKVPKSKRPAFLKKWSLNGAVLSRQTPREEASRPILADSSDLEDGADDLLSQAGSAREMLGQEDDGYLQLPDEGALSHSEGVVASSSATAAETPFRTAYAQDNGPVQSSTVDAGSEPDSAKGATTDARADETVLDEERSGIADLSVAKENSVGNVPSVQKRPPEEPLDPRPSKQQRTSIDLTDDHAADPVTIKEEQIDRNETKTFPTRQQAAEDENLEETLEDIDRELEIKHLEKRRAEVIRKQKQKQRQAALKRANEVKVKKEVIEIDDD